MRTDGSCLSRKRRLAIESSLSNLRLFGDYVRTQSSKTTNTSFWTVCSGEMGKEATIND